MDCYKTNINHLNDVTMEKEFRVLVTGAKALTGNKDELEFYWDSEDPMFAINFAQGFVEGLEWVNEITANRPLVQQMDGYWWRFERGTYSGMKVVVVDKDGDIVYGRKYRAKQQNKDNGKD